MNHLASKATLLGLGLLAAASTANAQTADRKTAIGLHANATQYRGDLGNNFFEFKNMPYSGGIDITRYIGKVLDIKLDLDYTRLRSPADEGKFNSAGRRFRAQTYGAGLGFKIKAPINDAFFLHPYVLIEPGFAWVTTDRYATPTGPNNFTRFGTFTGQIGGGLDFHLGESAILFLQASQSYMQTSDARLDGVDNNATTFWNKKDRYLTFSAGLRANLGKAKDEDMDGVSDKKDKCPGTPTGVKVDLNGCPIDTDGDGVADYQDKCPDVKGLAALQGCPDADNDGVADNDDKCPNTPAGVRVDASGCPLDADGDKVPDYLDKCPNTPAGTQVDANGCPLDRDGDGVPDYMDRCPDRAGPASNKGCPEMKAETQKVLKEATKYINFDFDKATLKPSSYPKLQQMVQILNEYPDYSLSIAGHTDSKGDDAYNLKLSYDRASSARAYMLSKGIPADRIEARGYGETKPIADNATAAGQALNRRVDFDPFLTGEANSAEVKYGAAPTVAELRAQGKMAPVKKAPAKKAPAKKKAPVKKARR
ncbi:OmpA family protein [Hymenobacter sp. H14-R3]|uniref:OmpA family protein n=1 Tax=Hymenobacter sp. H14-R3 TaxID=3046308 RepID=UPI0024B90FFB|nr:OmpA family protein [Hymenobacter sp. H14-R3]MDJ0364618.1 OmpA family protein [Hymenobacter sp. H14-R3]